MRTLIGRSWLTAGALALTACGSSSSGNSGNPAHAEAALRDFQSCESLYREITADARRRITEQAERLRAQGLVFPGPVPTVAAGQPAPAATPGPSLVPEGPEDFTQTNVQVQDVDEADVVESDGTHLYLLSDTSLLILDSWPPETTSLRTEVAIEGVPGSMFVDGDRALVISSILELRDAPFHPTSPCPLLGDPSPELARSTSCFTTTTKLTLIDLANEARVVREVYLEGRSVSARRHGDVARVILRGDTGHPSSIPDPWSIIDAPPYPVTVENLEGRISSWEDQALGAIDATVLADWLPVSYERLNGHLAAIEPDCARIHLPPVELTGSGSTQIVTLDIRDAASTIEETMLIGPTSFVFAGVDTMLLAQPEGLWRLPEGSTDRTAVHVFGLSTESPATTYRASGFIPGTPLSQFAFATRGEVFHMASTVRRRFEPTVSRVTSFRVDGAGLVEVGVTPDLAPDERIFAVRYLGTKAYVVTFRQIDPLFVIDLADPAAPEVLGEVEIPGFSEYIHPLGEDHLLTVGQDGDASGRLTGLALRIFDVSDPTAPRLTHVETLGGGGHSPAATNHLAFTFDADRGLLALPFSRFDGEHRSSLILLGVDPVSGFDFRGEVDHTSLGVPCESDYVCSAPALVERGLFIENWLYSISNEGLLVNAIADLSQVAMVELP